MQTTRMHPLCSRICACLAGEHMTAGGGVCCNGVLWAAPQATNPRAERALRDAQMKRGRRVRHPLVMFCRLLAALDLLTSYSPLFSVLHLLQTSRRALR